jgi:hypothetical protein
MNRRSRDPRRSTQPASTASAASGPDPGCYQSGGVSPDGGDVPLSSCTSAPGSFDCNDRQDVDVSADESRTVTVARTCQRGIEFCYSEESGAAGGAGVSFTTTSRCIGVDQLPEPCRACPTCACVQHYGIDPTRFGYITGCCDDGKGAVTFNDYRVAGCYGAPPPPRVA